jgi:hypothetical protein
MKTFIHNFKTPLRCGRTLSNLFFLLWQLPQHGSLYWLVMMRQLSLRWIALAYKEVHAGLVALMMAATVNHRIYVGLVIMFVVAPLSYCWYALFDRALHIHGWYHVNYFHLFFLIRFQIAFSVFLIGLYHFLPKEPRVKILAIPLGFLFMSIAVNVMATSNADIWRIADLSLWAAGACLSMVIFYASDYLTHRKFHQADAFEKRFDTIAQAEGMLPLDKIGSMFLMTHKERKAFQSKH